MSTKLEIIQGRPGGGKTRKILTELAREKNKNILICAPLKTLRDWMFNYLWELGVSNVAVVQSRGELCNYIAKLSRQANRIKQQYGIPKKLIYATFSTIFCKSCPVRDKCLYIQQFKSLAHIDNVTAVSTHDIALVLHMFKDWDIIYFDEFETFLNLINLPPIPKKTVEFMFKREGVEKEIARWIKSHWLDIGDSYIMPVEEIRAKKIIISSATLIKPLVRFVKSVFNVRFRHVKNIGEDVIFFLDKASTEKNRHALLSLLSELIESKLEGVLKHNDMGFVSPNYRVTQQLAQLLKKKGYSVVSDVDYDKPPSFYQSSEYNYVVTTKGKWFRGVNVADKPYIFGMFQWQNPLGEIEIQNPYILMKLREVHGPLYVYPLNEIKRGFIYAENVQSLFRLNRVPSQAHVMILTQEFRSALWYFMSWYLRKCKTFWGDYDELSRFLRDYV